MKHHNGINTPDLDLNMIQSIKKYNEEFRTFNHYLEETYSEVAQFLPKLEDQINQKSKESEAILEFMLSGINGTGAVNSIDEMNKIFINNTQTLEESIQKYSIIFKNIMSKLDSIQSLKNIIDQMKRLSNEIKIFSMNSVIISSRAGDKGKGFKSISHFIIELSDNITKNANLLNLQTSTIVTLYHQIKKTFTHLFEEIYSKEMKKTNQVLNQEIELTIKEIKQVYELLNDLLSRMNQPIQIIPKVMKEIQKQDIIKQSLNHIIEIFQEILMDERKQRSIQTTENELYFNAYLIFIFKKIKDDLEKTHQLILNLNQSIQKKFQEISENFIDVEEDQKFINDYLFNEKRLNEKKNFLKTTFHSLIDKLSNYKKVFDTETNLKKTLLESFSSLENVYNISSPLFLAIESFHSKMNNINVLAQIEISKNYFSNQDTSAIKQQFISMLDYLKQFKDDIQTVVKKNFQDLLKELHLFSAIQKEHNITTQENMNFLDQNLKELNNLYTIINDSISSIILSGQEIFKLVQESNVKLKVLDEMIQKNDSIRTQITQIFESFELKMKDYFKNNNLDLSIYTENNPFIQNMKKSNVNLEKHIQESGEVELF